MVIDLHTHSTASDGQLTPKELVERAAARGVTRLALTDHDTTAGVPEAQSAAMSHGIELVSGVEISSTWQRRTLHIVGLGIDITNTSLRNGLGTHQKLRTERAHAMADRLARYGVTDGYRRAHELAQGGQITRAHFASLLVEDGICRNPNQAFKRFLKPGKSAYQKPAWAEMATVIGWIKTAGGVAVLAHPFGYGFSGTRRREAISNFARASGDALEICTGTSNVEQESRSARDARGCRLAGSLGSDFHSPAQFWLDIGQLRTPPESVDLVI